MPTRDLYSIRMNLLNSLVLFVQFDSLRPSQQFFSYVGSDFPGFRY